MLAAEGEHADGEGAQLRSESFSEAERCQKKG